MSLCSDSRLIATVSRGKAVLAVIRNRFNSLKDDWAVSPSLKHSTEMPLCVFNGSLKVEARRAAVG